MERSREMHLNNEKVPFEGVQVEHQKQIVER